MDTVTMMRKVIDQTTALVSELTPDDLAQASPCDGWTVRDVLNHITAGARIFGLAAAEGSVPPEALAALSSDVLGDDPLASWKEASQGAVDSFAALDSLDRPVSLPFGEMTAEAALGIATFDVATHACDIARGTGRRFGDEALLESVIELGQRILPPEWRMPGVFEAARDAPAGAPAQDRLLAFAGRRP
jgi:uncharacterized protein (TIGR03086 family)